MCLPRCAVVVIVTDQNVTAPLGSRALLKLASECSKSSQGCATYLIVVVSITRAYSPCSDSDVRLSVGERSDKLLQLREVLWRIDSSDAAIANVHALTQAARPH